MFQEKFGEILASNGGRIMGLYDELFSFFATTNLYTTGREKDQTITNQSSSLYLTVDHVDVKLVRFYLILLKCYKIRIFFIFSFQEFFNKVEKGLKVLNKKSLITY